MRTINPTCGMSRSKTMPPVRAERLDRQIQSRRDTLAKLASLSLAVPALWNAAGDRLVAEAVDMPVTAPVVAVDTSAKLKSYIARDFFFQYNPQEFKLLQDPNDINPKPGGPRGDNPVRAEVIALDDLAKVTVVQSQAAKYKQTLLQVTDISLLGTPQEVLKLILPPTTRVLSSSVGVFPQPPRDTGTVMGVIERDPVQIYRYDVVLPSGQYAAVAVGAILGRVLLLGAATSEENWEGKKEALQAIANSFKLLPK